LHIFDLIAEADVILNTGHISGAEAVRVLEVARSHGVTRMLAPASYFTVEEALAVAEIGAKCEFSFFVMGHATQIGQTMGDSERHRARLVQLDSVGELIHAVGPGQTILSSDSGAYVLPPPVEALREFLVMIQSLGFSDEEMRLMCASNPAELFLNRERD